MALRVVGGGAVALPRIRPWMSELTLLLPVPGMRLKVRVLVALPGIFDRSPRPGASRSSARVVLGQSGACLRPPRPSGVAVVDSSSTFAGVSPGVGWLGRRFQSPMASSRRSGSLPVLLVSGFWSGFFHPLLGAPLLGRLSVVPAAGLTAVSLAPGLAFGGLPCGGGLPRGY